jgi:hypothetical protein
LKTGGEEGSPKRSRGVGFREGGRLPFHGPDGGLPLLLRGRRGRVPIWTTVVDLFLGLLRVWNPQLAHVGPLVFGKGIHREAKTRRMFGAAPKIGRTARFQDQE